MSNLTHLELKANLQQAVASAAATSADLFAIGYSAIVTNDKTGEEVRLNGPLSVVVIDLFTGVPL